MTNHRWSRACDGRTLLVVLLLTAAFLGVGLGAPDVARAERDIGRLCPAELANRTDFSDVTPGSAHARGIYCIAATGITVGLAGGTTYGPDQTVKRGQMATFLRRMLEGTNKPVPPGESTGAAPGHTHQPAIDALIAAGVIPQPSGAFRPDDPIRRDVMAGWMQGTWQWITGSRVTASGQPFHDMAGNAFAADVAGLYVHGVINGKDTGYDPAAAVNRGQMGSFIARLMVMHADAGHVPGIGPVTTTTVAPTTTTTAAPAGVTRDAAAEEQVLAHHNAQRAAAGAAPLVRHGCLDDLASEWAHGMAAEANRSGSTAARLVHRADFGRAGTGACIPSRRAWAENIGFDDSLTQLLQRFMGSSVHRGNILNPGSDHVGIGAWRDANGFVWVTVNFTDT